MLSSLAEGKRIIAEMFSSRNTAGWLVTQLLNRLYRVVA